MKPSSLFLLGLTLLARSVFADETATVFRPIGRLGNAHHLEIEGNQAYPANGLRKGLAQDLAFVLASHPSEPLDPFLPLIAGRLRAGYRAGGFPDAAIEVSCHGSGDEAKIRISISEGRRFRQGKILFSGGSGIDLGQLVDALQNQSRLDGDSAFARRLCLLVETHEQHRLAAAATGQLNSQQIALDYLKKLGTSVKAVADWQPGEPVILQSGDEQPLLDEVVRCLADQGRPLARVTTAHERREDGTVDLRIRVEDPGPAAVIGTLAIEGNEANPAEEIFRAAGLATGQPVTPRRIDQALVALWRTGRFFPLTIDTRPSDGDRSETDVRIRVDELAGVPPLTTAASPEQETVMRFIDWLNQGLPGGELLIGQRASATERWEVGVSAGEVIGDVTFAGGASAMSVSLSDGGASFSLRRDGRCHAASFGRFADKFGAAIQLLPAGSDEMPLSLFTGVGFSSERAIPFHVDVLVSPAFAFLEAHRIRREQDQVVVSISNTDVSLVLDGATGRPLAARSGKIESKILTATGSVRRRGKELEAEIAKLQPGQSAVSLWDAYHELLTWMSVIKSDQADDPAFGAVRRAAGLLDLVAKKEVLAPLKDWLAAQQASGKGADEFVIPASTDHFQTNETMPLMVGLGCVWLAEEYLPEAGWPTSFSRELLFLSGGKTRHTRAVMDSLLQDPSIGPVGCALCARLLDQTDAGLALRFRRKALQQANAGAFREDWKLLLDPSTPLGATLGRSLEAMAGFSSADEAKAAELLPGEMAEWLHRFLLQLRQRPVDQPWSGAIAPSMDRLWNGYLGALLRDQLERRIPPAADPTETAATIDGVPVPRFLVKILTELHRGPLGCLLLPERDEARPWTNDPALACAVRAMLVGTHAQKTGRYPGQEQVDDFLHRHFPDLDGMQDDAWLAELGMTRSQIATMGALFSLGPALVTDLKSGLEDAPEVQVLRDYYKARESTYAVKVDADFIFVAPSNALRPADLALCYQHLAGLGEVLAGGKSAAEIESSGALAEVTGAQVFSRENADLTSFQFTAMKAIAALHPGEATEPLVLGNGIAVFVLRASRYDRAPAFDEVRDAVLEHWQAEQLEAATREWFETREAHADIQVLEEPAQLESR